MALPCAASLSYFRGEAPGGLRYESKRSLAGLGCQAAKRAAHSGHAGEGSWP